MISLTVKYDKLIVLNRRIFVKMEILILELKPESW